MGRVTYYDTLKDVREWLNKHEPVKEQMPLSWDAMEQAKRRMEEEACQQHQCEHDQHQG